MNALVLKILQNITSMNQSPQYRHEPI